MIYSIALNKYGHAIRQYVIRIPYFRLHLQGFHLEQVWQLADIQKPGRLH